MIVVVLALALPFAACGGKAKTKLTLEEAKGPGRDLELYRQGVDAIRKGSFDEGRILLNTMINTYSDSPMIKMSKLSIADSYYLQGGSKGLAQAEIEYRDWIQFFPDDALADETMLKIAEVHLRQVMAADRDTTHARLAERQLKDLLRRYPNTDSKEQVEQLMNQVQEILAMHELKVARFYFEIRESAQAAQMRTEEILNKYPNFSRFDEALYLHAKAMELQEDTETASRDLSRIVTSHPHSEYLDRAKETLKKWGKPVPDPDPAKVLALLRPLRAGRGTGKIHRGRHHSAGNHHGRRRAGSASRRRALSCIVRQESLAPARSRAAAGYRRWNDRSGFRNGCSESDPGARQTRFRDRSATWSARNRCPAFERQDQLSRCSGARRPRSFRSAEESG